jgi:glucose uptake protein
MFIVDSLGLAIVFCVITMLGWGSWANTQKLAGKERWEFPLFYWDYAIGVALLSVVLAFALGSTGGAGMPVMENLRQMEAGPVSHALISGAIFNLSNILLVVAISAAGMSVAFPVGVGLALVIGTVTSYVQAPKGNAVLLSLGVLLVVAAMLFSAMAYSRLPRPKDRGWRRGIVFAVIAGCLMGLFYPELSRAISPGFQTGNIQAGYLTPYSALLLFAAGVLVSNIVINTVFLKSAGLNYGD